MARRAIIALWGCLLAVHGAWAETSLEERIDRAAELNVTAPWRESQALLDEIKADLDGATPRQRARVRLLESRNLALSGDCDAAIGTLEPLREGDIAPDLRLSAFRISANCAFNRWHFEDGFRYLRAGLDLLPRVDAPEPRINLLTVAAYYHSQAGEPAQGVEYGREALTIAEASGDTRQKCVALFDLSLAIERAESARAALEIRRRAVDVCQAANDPVYIGATTGSLGELLLTLGEVDEALEMTRKGVEVLEAAEYRAGVLNNRANLANALVAAGRHAEAESLLVPLIDAFESRESWQQLDQVYRLLSEIAESRGDYRLALEHHKGAEEAAQAFLDRERAMRLAYLQVEFDTRRKEQEIALLRERNQVLELEETTRRQQYYIAAGGIVALAVIGLLLLVLLLKSRSDRRRLLRLSQHDSLTGLFNHTNFFRRAARALDECHRDGRPFTLLLADVDHFKLINDRHGHVVGDQALREVGRCFRVVFGSGTVSGRIGGEEFGVALPGVDAARARELIGRFNRRLVRVAERGGVMQVTMSYGLAEGGGGVALDELRQQADDALYEAKRQGRNRTVVAGEPAA